MNVKNIAHQLQKAYPGKQIIFNNPTTPTEIICEIVPTEENPKESIAIAVIEKSIPHVHKIITEKYEVIKGKVTVYRNKESFKLAKGQTITISPNQIHYAVGKDAWIKVTATPGWTKEDHQVVIVDQ